MYWTGSGALGSGVVNQSGNGSHGAGSPLQDRLRPGVVGLVSPLCSNAEVWPGPAPCCVAAAITRASTSLAIASSCWWSATFLAIASWFCWSTTLRAIAFSCCWWTEGVLRAARS
jgi:hypothetical protein